MNNCFASLMSIWFISIDAVAKKLQSELNKCSGATAGLRRKNGGWCVSFFLSSAQYNLSINRSLGADCLLSANKKWSWSLCQFDYRRTWFLMRDNDNHLVSSIFMNLKFAIVTNWQCDRRLRERLSKPKTRVFKWLEQNCILSPLKKRWVCVVRVYFLKCHVFLLIC